jgi:hypothetical protein
MRGLELLVATMSAGLRIDPEGPRVREAVRELRDAGLKGSEALAWLIESLLLVRSPLIAFPLTIAGEMEFSPRLYAALKDVGRAGEFSVGRPSRWSEITAVVHGVKFAGGVLDDTEVAAWSEDTGKLMKELASRALGSMCRGATIPAKPYCAGCGKTQVKGKDNPILTFLVRPPPGYAQPEPHEMEYRDYRWHPFWLCASCARWHWLMPTLVFGGMAVILTVGILVDSPAWGLLWMIVWAALCLTAWFTVVPGTRLGRDALALRRRDTPERAGYRLSVSGPPDGTYVVTWNPAEPRLDLMELLSSVPAIARNRGRITM